MNKGMELWEYVLLQGIARISSHIKVMNLILIASGLSRVSLVMYACILTRGSEFLFLEWRSELTNG